LSKTIKPDEYFNDGIFELARYGNQAIVKNNISPEDFLKFQEFYADKFVAKKTEICDMVKRLRNDTAKCDPIMLLQYCRDMAMMAQIGKYSEFDFSEDENIIVRVLEYMQSILVSTNQRNCVWTDAAKHESHMIETVELAKKLFVEIHHFYIYWGHFTLKNGIIESDLVNFIIEAQALYLVRGDRYQIFQLAPLQKLLPTHNDTLIELFGTSAIDILSGLEKLEYSLSQGSADAWNGILRSHREFVRESEEIENKYGIESAEMLDLFQRTFTKPNEQLLKNFEDALSTALNDVKTITGWDCRLIQALALQIGEDNSFFNNSEYAGWPVVEFPTSRKPFIEIDNKVYCFNYYSLFDNFYRIIQKEIFRCKPIYVDDWSNKQAQASEMMVEEIFCKLLPGAQTYRDNYYPVNNSLKQMNENDLLVLFDDVLIIIEVKAGSFPLTPPITDYSAHINAYKSLVEKADHQCYRTLLYINNGVKAKFYTSDKQEKVTICKSDFREVYTFSVTVDNINSFASKAEKLSFLSLKSKTISISYDDLMSYAEYFDSPLYFLHFLRQRKRATAVEKLSLQDELDHLGLYIEYNVYPYIFENVSDDVGRVFFTGYRENLDNYLCKLYHPELQAEKPLQEVPALIKDIVRIMEVQNIPHRVLLSSFLLDFSGDERTELVNAIDQTLKRKLQTTRPLPLLRFGDVRYCIFINIQNQPDMDYQARQDYAYATALRNQEKSLTWIDLHVDKALNILEVGGRECRAVDIKPDDFDRLQELSAEYAKSRVETAKRKSSNGKLGRNEYCPCGSERKYKRCCIDL